MADVNVYVFEGANNSFPNYSTLAGAIADNQQDLTATEGILYITITGSWSSPEVVNPLSITGFTTSTDYYVSIKTEGAARHSGQWSDSAYTLAVTAAPSYYGAIQIVSVQNLRIDGLQILNTVDSAPTNTVCGITIHDTGQDIDELHVSNCFLKATGTVESAEAHQGIGRLVRINDGGSFYIYNNVVSGFSVGIQRAYSANLCTGVFYNNTVLNSTYQGIHMRASADGQLYLKNNIVQNSVTDYYLTYADTDSETNISSDTTSPNSALRQKNVTFVDSSNWDYRPATSDLAAKGNGTDLSTDADGKLSFAVDAAGNARTIPWDIGALNFGSSSKLKVFGALIY